MSEQISLSIDGRPVAVAVGETVLAAARKLAIDIPTLCYLEKCGPLNSCQVCLVKANGKLVPSCGTKATPGLVVESETAEVHEARRTALELLFSDHVGDCLSPCHRLCPLQLNIPAMLRLIQAERFAEAAAALRQTLPLAGILGRLCHHPCEQGCRRGNWDSPAAIRDMERVVADLDLQSAAPVNPICAPASGWRVVVVGAGPTGLTAAFYLARQGHRVTLCDRNAEAGGSLRHVPEAQLPAAIRAAEIATLVRMGVEFKPNVTFGREVTADGLARGFDAIVLTVGELDENAASLGVPLAGKFVQAHPGTGVTSVSKLFAAGSCVRAQKQLVKAMTEGRLVAECVHRFLLGQPVRRPDKPFSSLMGRLDPAELKQFIRAAKSSAPAVSPCDRCAGHSRAEAALESSRCLHCDCASSGNCVLQHYAQVYHADANRFRSERRQYEQQRQPGGIRFEPGKCISCGICVKLTELAAEPLGLTFIGRGFEVRVAAPFNETISAGLQKVASECVEQCPTGALEFADD